MNSSTLSNNKQHFQILDGLRGIAAIAIVIFHFAEWIYAPTENLIGHGFLAVDFFFCLSGFVIAYAYDSRIKSMGVLEFIQRRLIRLHPLVVLGAILGLIGFIFDPFSNTADNYTITQLFTLFISTIFLIPYPVMEDRYFNLFGLNPPTWSLFWEYVANIVYVMGLYKLGRHYILILTFLATIILGTISYKAGNLLGGWSGETFWHGGARIFFSFLAGMCIYRYDLIIKNKLGFLGLSLLLILAFITPQLEWNWLLELLIIIFYFPLIVSLGAGTTLASKYNKLCVFAGDISYPLYMTHYFAISIFGSYFVLTNPDHTTLHLITIFGTLFLIGFAYLSMVLFDTPVRKYLSNKIMKKQ
jgi:peptidoglycan/LPS O-acetylase OafA/YrhL